MPRTAGANSLDLDGALHMDKRFRKRMSRYLAGHEDAARRYLQRLEVEEWFDLWHVHVDWKCRGNKARTLVAQAIYRLLEEAERKFAQRQAPIQVFATLCANTGDSALYLHSENPNGTDFPHPFEGVAWGGDIPEEIAGVLAPEHEVGAKVWSDERVYYIRRRT